MRCVRIATACRAVALLTALVGTICQARVALANAAIAAIVDKAAEMHAVPADEVASFKAKLDQIESAPGTAVRFEAMSPWRQREVENAIGFWASTLPPSAERNDIVLQGHQWQSLQRVVELLVVPPREMTSEARRAIELQLARFRTTLSETVGPRIATLVGQALEEARTRRTGRAAVDDGPTPSELDAIASGVIDRIMAGISLSPDDDVSPLPRWPLQPDVVDRLDRALQAAVPEGDPMAIRLQDDLLRGWRAAKNRGEDEVASRILREEVVPQVEIQLAIVRPELIRGGSAILDAYRDAVPADSRREYDRLSKTLDEMIDRKSIADGFAERKALVDRDQKQWLAEQKQSFDDSARRDPPLPAPSLLGSGTRSIALIVVNGVIVGVLLLTMLRRLERRS
jgi:hypothetical protein